MGNSIDREKVIKGLHCCSHTDGVNCIYCPYDNKDTDCTALMAMDVLALLKEQESVVRCKDCVNWIPGTITDKDDFVPPKCGKYHQMVGHSADDYCSLAERKEGR